MYWESRMVAQPGTIPGVASQRPRALLCQLWDGSEEPEVSAACASVHSCCCTLHVTCQHFGTLRDRSMGSLACKHRQTKRRTGTSAWGSTATLAPMHSATNGVHSRPTARHRVSRGRVHNMSGRWLEGRLIIYNDYIIIYNNVII